MYLDQPVLGKTGSLVQTVDILRDERFQEIPVRQYRQCPVGCIWPGPFEMVEHLETPVPVLQPLLFASNEVLVLNGLAPGPYPSW